MVLPALLLLFSLLVSFFSTVALQIRCREVATSVARSIERGESSALWSDYAELALPEAKVSLRNEGAFIVVEVSQRSALLLTVQGAAVAFP